MAIDITLPKLSDTMEEGKVLRWLKRVGDRVAPGDVLAEVETDKADMEVEASDGGVLTEIRVPEGETAQVGSVLAVLGEGDGQAAKGGGEAGASPEGDAPAARRATRAPAAKRAEEKAAEPVADADASAPSAEDDADEGDGADDEDGEAAAEESTADAARLGSGRLGEAQPAAPPRKQASSAPSLSRRLRASPLAQRLARERGVDLGGVRGSGAEGKIVARDLEAREEGDTKARAESAEPKAAAELASGRHELSKMRQSIARRMSEAKNGVPHFYVVAEVEMDEATRLLEALRQQVDAKITISHLVLKAAAMALEEHPRVNGQWADGAVIIPESVNIGLAVAVDDGLVVPVVHGCERLTIGELASEARRLVAAARAGRFSGDDLKGGTFSISNMGMLDVDEFSAILNPPQAAILAVASIKQRAVVRDGGLAVARTMRVTLSCDHRQLNGVEGARFLETLATILENPLRMVV